MSASCSIEVGDYRSLLNCPEPVDLILTDPPYAISRKTGFQSIINGVERFAVSMDFGAWDHTAPDLDALATAMYTALRKGGTAIVWYDLWKVSWLAEAMTRAGFGMIRLIIWEKSNPVPLNMRATYLSNSREIAVVGVKGGSRSFTRNTTMACISTRYRDMAGTGSTPHRSPSICSRDW